MKIQNNLASSYGYGLQTQAPQEPKPLASTQESNRQTYGTALLEKFDDKAYQAFVNSTAEFSLDDKRLAARTLERTAAMAAANEYAVTHGVELTQDLTVVYSFFEHYQDVVTSDQIKHILNSKLQDRVSVEGKAFESEQFFENFTAQLGGNRMLDLRA
jgi:hypothetical protein